MRSVLGRFFSALTAMAVLGTFDPSTFGQTDQAASSEMIANIRVKSLVLLRDIVPTPKPNKPLKEMELEGGTVRWGNLFSQSETVALVSLAQRPKDHLYDYPPSHLSLLAWEKGRWIFRQFLGNADRLEVHHRKGTPAHFVQGSFHTARYEGEQRSWFYDAARKKLVPTGWDEWGPFYIAGNYICYSRGMERLAHWDTRWIYPCINGKKGKLLACFHQDDKGRFTVSFRDPKSGAMKHWSFTGDENGEPRYRVAFVEDENDHVGESVAELTLRGRDDLTAEEYCFELFTGLSRDLLEEQWRDELARRSPVEKLPVTDLRGMFRVRAGGSLGRPYSPSRDLRAKHGSRKAGHLAHSEDRPR